MAEPAGDLGALELQATSAETRAASWSDCATDHHHEQPDSRWKTFRASGSRTSDIQKPDASFRTAQQAALHHRDNKRISIRIPSKRHSVSSHLSGAGGKKV